MVRPGLKRLIESQRVKVQPNKTGTSKMLGMPFNKINADSLGLLEQKLQFLSGDNIFGEILSNTFCINILFVFTVGLDI